MNISKRVSIAITDQWALYFEAYNTSDKIEIGITYAQKESDKYTQITKEEFRRVLVDIGVVQAHE